MEPTKIRSALREATLQDMIVELERRETALRETADEATQRRDRDRSLGDWGGTSGFTALADQNRDIARQIGHAIGSLQAARRAGGI